MTASRTVTAARSQRIRIRGLAVAPLVPLDGPVHALLIGEAPGPRGADKSGIPFFGDAAGKHLYAALRSIGAIVVTSAIDDMKWDGAVFAAARITPTVHGVALSNAFDRCPTDDGVRFRAPRPDELDGAENRARLLSEIQTLQTRGLRGVVTLGRVATRTVQGALAAAEISSLNLRALPHPSAQGLLSKAPDHGRGARLADLQAQWMHDCIDAVIAAGFPRPRS